MNWSQIHVTTFLWVGISVKTNTFFCTFGKTSRVPLGKLPRTTGCEPLYYSNASTKKFARMKRLSNRAKSINVIDNLFYSLQVVV